MKKASVIILTIVGLAAILLGTEYFFKHSGTEYYTQVNQPTSSKLDKDNNTGKVYGKTYTYKVTGYDKDGNAKNFEFNGMKKLTEGHYVKVLWSNSKGAKSYEGIQFNDIPEAAQAKLK